MSRDWNFYSGLPIVNSNGTNSSGSIQHSSGKHGVSHELLPFPKAFVAGKDDTTLFIPGTYELILPAMLLLAF
jgi:hypothetical protein